MRSCQCALHTVWGSDVRPHSAGEKRIEPNPAHVGLLVEERSSHVTAFACIPRQAIVGAARVASNIAYAVHIETVPRTPSLRPSVAHPLLIRCSFVAHSLLTCCSSVAHPTVEPRRPLHEARPLCPRQCTDTPLETDGRCMTGLRKRRTCTTRTENMVPEHSFPNQTLMLSTMLGLEPNRSTTARPTPATAPTPSPRTPRLPLSWPCLRFERTLTRSEAS